MLIVFSIASDSIGVLNLIVTAWLRQAFFTVLHPRLYSSRTAVSTTQVRIRRRLASTDDLMQENHMSSFLRIGPQASLMRAILGVANDASL